MKTASYLLLFLLLSQCRVNRYLKRVDTYKDGYYDKPFLSDSLKNAHTKLEPMLSPSIDSLLGYSSFSILGGFHGFSLNLKPNHRFSLVQWSCLTRGIHSSGKWFVQDSLIVLKGKFGKRLKLRPYQYKWAYFLVPLGKNQDFMERIPAVQHKINSLSQENRILGKTGCKPRDYDLLSKVCFIKLTPKVGVDSFVVLND